VGVRECQFAEVVRPAAQLGLPVLPGFWDRHLVEHKLDNSIEQSRSVRCVPIEGHRVTAEFLTEPAPGEGIQTLCVDQSEGGRKDPFSRERTTARRPGVGRFPTRCWIAHWSPSRVRAFRAGR
jgi:hypothetical protein